MIPPCWNATVHGQYWRHRSPSLRRAVHCVALVASVSNFLAGKQRVVLLVAGVARLRRLSTKDWHTFYIDPGERSGCCTGDIVGVRLPVGHVDGGACVTRDESSQLVHEGLRNMLHGSQVSASDITYSRSPLLSQCSRKKPSSHEYFTTSWQNTSLLTDSVLNDASGGIPPSDRLTSGQRAAARSGRQCHRLIDGNNTRCREALAPQVLPSKVSPE